MDRRIKTEKDYHRLAELKGWRWLGPLVPVREKTAWLCGKGHYVYQSYSSGIQCGCSRCSKKYSLQEADYYWLARDKNIKWVGEKPVNNKTKTWWECPEGHRWKAVYRKIFLGHSCPHCAGNARKTKKEYQELARQAGIEWLGPFVTNTKIKTKWRCKYDHEWETTYEVICMGSGCPICCQSLGEKRIREFLGNVNIYYEIQKKFDKCRHVRPLPFDFYFMLGNCHFLVEYDGIQHNQSVLHFGGDEYFELVKERDMIKDRFAEEYGFVLIRVPYHIKNIESYLKFQIEKYLDFSIDSIKPKKQMKKKLFIVDSAKWIQLGFSYD